MKEGDTVFIHVPALGRVDKMCTVTKNTPEELTLWVVNGEWELRITKYNTSQKYEYNEGIERFREERYGSRLDRAGG